MLIALDRSEFATYSTDFKDSTILTLFVRKAKKRFIAKLVPHVNNTVYKYEFEAM